MERKISALKRFLVILTVSMMVLAFFAYYMSGRPVDPKDIDRNLLKQPVQKKTERKSFKASYGGRTYTIVPRADYELWGLIVSENDFNNLLNIDYDAKSINSKDLGIIWGSNLLGDDFHHVNFRNDAWMLECSWDGDVTFNLNEISNNHILAKPKIKKLIHEIGPGDQVYLKGILVDYSFKMGQGSYNRTTSLKRDDTGNGACEVFLVEEMTVYKRSKSGWQVCFKAALSMLFVLIIIRVIMFFLLNSPLMMRWQIENDAISAKEDS